MKTINKAYKFRIYPTNNQRLKLSKTFGCVRFLWNQEVNLFNEKKDSKSYKELKVEYPWLSEVSASSLQQKEMDFKDFKNQFFSKTRKKKLGRPRFHSRRDKQSYRLPNQKFYLIENKIQLEKIGKIKIVLDRIIPEDAKFLSVTVSKNRTNQYFVSISVEQQVLSKEKTNKSIGIDVGLKNFLTTSNGDVIDNPKYFSENQAKIGKLQRHLSRKRGSRKGEIKSSRWLKLNQRINMLHLKVFNCRNNFLHNVSTSLVNNYDVICIEDLNTSGLLKNHRLAKSIQDVSWSQFFSILKYKCDWYGKDLVMVNRFYPSSKTCFSCGNIKENLKLEDRTYTCNCGYVCDRDLNAAKNILAFGVTEAQRMSSSATDKDQSRSNYVETSTLIGIE